MCVFRVSTSELSIGRSVAMLGVVQRGRPVDVVCSRGFASRHHRERDTEGTAAARAACHQSWTSTGLAAAAVHQHSYTGFNTVCLSVFLSFSLCFSVSVCLSVSLALGIMCMYQYCSLITSAYVNTYSQIVLDKFMVQLMYSTVIIYCL